MTFWRLKSQGNLILCFKECNNNEGTGLHASVTESLRELLVHIQHKSKEDYTQSSAALLQKRLAVLYSVHCLCN